MPQEDTKVLDSVLNSASDGYPFVVDCGRHGDIEFEMTRVPRQRRQGFIEDLPEELVEYMQDQADEREQDIADVESMDDISDAAPDDAPSDSMIGKAEVQMMENLIVESFEHPSIVGSELRDLMELWPDKMFYSTTFLILGISGESHGVEGFQIDTE